MQPPNEQRVERRLAAIFAADVAGYSRLMSQDEAGTLRALAAAREVMDRLIRDHGGRIANTAGDSVLAEFPSAVDAVQCAVAVQDRLSKASAGEPEHRRLQFRIGVHVGDVVVRGNDLLGDGVNIAARLEGLAEPGGIVISGAAHGYVRKALPLTYTDMGEQPVKNFDEPVRTFSLAAAAIPARSSSRGERPSIAVLPFGNMGGEKDDYFADGITEDIITALTRMRWFHVVARNSVFGYERGAHGIREAARDLGASYVLEGNVRRGGARLRLTAQLIVGASGIHVWAKRYDRDLHDIFEVQDDLTESIVASIEPELGKAERERARAKRPESLSAWDLCQRGMWHLYRRTKQDFTEAEALLERALQIDANLAPALCALSETHVIQVLFGLAENPDARREEAMRLARRAVDLDDRNPVAHWAMARAHVVAHQHEAAIPFAEAALALNPTLAWAQYLLGLCHIYSGRVKKGVPYLQSAISLSPYDPYLARFIALKAEAHLFVGEYEEAVACGREAVRLASTAHWSGHTVLAAALGHLGRIEEANTIMMDLLYHRPDFSRDLMRRSISLRRDEFLALYFEGLRLAGLPE